MKRTTLRNCKTIVIAPDLPMSMTFVTCSATIIRIAHEGKRPAWAVVPHNNGQVARIHRDGGGDWGLNIPAGGVPVFNSRHSARTFCTSEASFYVLNQEGK